MLRRELFAALLIAESWLHLTGPDDQPITLNPAGAFTLRPPRHAEHFAKGIKCIITTPDGHFATVKEECSAIDRMRQPPP